jgi:dUTPase
MRSIRRTDLDEESHSCYKNMPWDKPNDDKVRFRKLSPNATIPRITDSIGFDLHASEHTMLLSNEFTVIHTDIKLLMPPGYSVEFIPCEQLVHNHGLVFNRTMFNNTDEITVLVATLRDPYHITIAQRIGCLVFTKEVIPDIADDDEDTYWEFIVDLRCGKQ